MGTKNNPGKFDCYLKADADEPVFVLLGRDPVASIVVQIWAGLRERLDPEDPKCDEALACASTMEGWAAHKGKADEVKLARELYKAGQEEVHLTCVSGEVDRLSERVRELEKERDEDRDRYDTTVGHVRVLEAQCRSAADVVRHCVAINDSDGGMRDRDELLQLEKELREADPGARVGEGSRLRKLEALCHRAAEIVAKQTLAKAITGAFPFSLVGEQGRKELDDLVKELRDA